MSDSYRGGWDLGKILKVPNIRKGLLFTLLVLVITRLGAQIPVPGVSRDVFSNWFANQQSGAVSLFDMMTGGSFSQMSIFALSITPYITASIIMQLMTIIIPSLEELQKDQDGRDKINEYTFYLSIGLSALQAVAMGIAFYRSNSLAVKSIPAVIVVIVALITGAVVLIFLGEEITKHGVGNGISMILLFNIVSRMPQDIGTLYDAYLKGRNIVQAGLAFLIILAIILFMIAFCVCLQDAYVRIPVQNSSKMVGRRAVGGVGSNIPFMINASNVIPVIFAGSLMSLPELITSFTGYQAKGAVAWIFNMLSQNNWFNPDNMSYTVGYILYAVLIIAFAYFYTSITFNPIEVADKLKERGSFIPGQRPGRQTVEYLQRVSDTTIVIGAIGLLIVSTIPIVLAGLLGVDVSFGGTSIIIIVGVVLETIRKLDSQVSERHLRGLFSSNR